ncbi:MAG: U32 family peptidase [Clostridia bacterium]|nr:U32 family peptidase [Clostridia bacterium]
MKKPELLAPAGDMMRLRYALAYGADAIYVAYRSFGMRAACANFDEEQLRQAVALCHSQNVKLYVTVNTYPTVEEMNKLPKFLTLLEEIRPDGMIIADIGVMTLAGQYAPSVPIHVSTQANITNPVTALTYVKMGATRLVLARECSLEDIRQIKAAVGNQAEIECFVHGAMCMSVSGRCHLSAFLTGRDANRGACAQPCRWEYTIVEKMREGQYFPVVQDDRGTYIFNSKDMCMIEHIGDLIEAGVDSFKIEGRMKTFYYVATTVKAYREAIDEYAANGKLLAPEYHLTQAGKASHRDFSTGFYYAPMDENGFNTQNGGYIRPYDVVATVEKWEDGRVLICQKNKFAVGDELEVLSPCGKDFTFTVQSLTTAEGEAVADAPHSQQLLWIPCEKELGTMDVLRKKSN